MLQYLKWVESDTGVILQLLETENSSSWWNFMGVSSVLKINSNFIRSLRTCTCKLIPYEINYERILEKWTYFIKNILCTWIDQHSTIYWLYVNLTLSLEQCQLHLSYDRISSLKRNLISVKFQRSIFIVVNLLVSTVWHLYLRHRAFFILRYVYHRICISE